MLSDRTRALVVPALAGLAGLAVACVAFDWSFINGTGPRWTWPSGDRAAYLTPILYFVRDPWRLPIFALPEMGYPEGGSVIFNDAIPLGALVSKLMYATTGMFVNHVGWWVLVSYPLQIIMGLRLAWALGERSSAMAWCIGSWALFSFPLLTRFGHVALTSQFLVLWALALYFEQVAAKRPFVREQAMLSIVALLINPYLWVMTSVLLGTSWIALWKDRALGVRDLLTGAAAGAGVCVVAWACGHFASPTQMLSIPNDGVWSWNLASMIVPRPAGVWGLVTRGIPRNVTGGQYEGESYLGMGPLILLLVCLVTRPRAVAQALARHWPLAIVLLLCAVFAASTRVYFSSRLLFEYAWPAPLQAIAGMLRAQGRFIWPVTYLLMMAPAVLLLRHHRSTLATTAVVIATITQVIETAPLLRWSRTWSTEAAPVLIDVDTMGRWFRAHDRLWQYPSFWCGGVKPLREPEETAFTRQVQMQVLAARLGLPNNSVYMSRPLKDCAREAEWARHPQIEPGVLYIFLKDVPDFTPAVRDLIRAPACRDVGWGFACSRRVLEPF